MLVFASRHSHTKTGKKINNHNRSEFFIQKSRIHHIARTKSQNQEGESDSSLVIVISKFSNFKKEIMIFDNSPVYPKVNTIVSMWIQHCQDVALSCSFLESEVYLI
jgi:hypothetical protein